MFKRTVALLLCVCLCLCLCSCGNSVKVIKKGKDAAIKYPQGHSEHCFSFTAPADGEYVFTHTSDAPASAVLYKDETLTSRVAGSAKTGNFGFTAELKAKQTVYLVVSCDAAEESKGTLRVDAWSQKIPTDENLGHPIALQLENPVQAVFDDPACGILYSFTAAGDGTYVLSAGGMQVDVSLYSDNRCTQPVDAAANASYPPEHFSTGEAGAFTAVRDMKGGETVYLMVRSAAGTGSATVKVNGAYNSPSARSAREQFEYLINEVHLHPHLLLCSDVEKDFATSFGDLYFTGYFGTAVTDYSVWSQAVGNGKDIETYISKSELDLLADGYYAIYRINDIQTKVNSIWGSGRIDVSRFFDTNGKEDSTFAYTMLATEKGYLFSMAGFGDDGIISCYKVLDAKATAQGTTVTAVGLIYNYFTGEVTDAAGYLGASKSFGKLKTSSLPTFDDYMDKLGTDESAFTPMDFVFYSRRDGVKLWGVYLQGQAEYSVIPNTAPELPEVIPSVFEPERTAVVKASSGLRQRTGPGTDYSTIVIVPNKTQVRCYGEKDGWYYVVYCGRYGWMSGDYLEFP